jgi:hypothetical protein
MTRLLTDGAETGSTIGIISFSGTTTVDSSVKKSGSYSYKNSNDSSYFGVDIPASSELYIKTWFYSVYGSGSGLAPIWWKNGTTALGYLRLTSPYPEFYVGSSKVATSSRALEEKTWYLVEVHVKIHDSTGVLELRIDGLLDTSATFNGDTKPGADATITQICFNHYASSSTAAYTDDIAINDTAGAVDNSWCGDGHVIKLAPNANGDSSDLVGSDGNSTDNYALVDDVPHDTDTTYVESATGGDYDLYNLSACGLDATHVIQRVWTESMAKDTTTAGGQIKHVMKTNSTEYDSSAIDLGTSYALQKGAEQLVNPQTTSAWTPAELDALQVGVKIVA